MAKLVRKEAPQEAVEFLPNARRIGDGLAEHKGIDIRGYDVRGLTLVADCFIMASAHSEPHFKALLGAVKESMREVGVPPLHVEGEATGGWIIVDYGGIVVHLFREDARAFYDLDGLWGDAPEVDLALEP